MIQILRTACLAAAVMAAGPGWSEVIDFSAGEGFTSGKANNQNGLLAQDGIEIETQGTGLARVPGIGFQRLLLFANRPEVDVAGLESGQSLVFVASGVVVDRTADNIPTLVFGLTDTLDVGKAGVKLGAQLRLNPAGDVLLDAQGYESDRPVDTGFDVGQAFDLRIEIVKNDDGTFDATSTVGPASLLTADDVSLQATRALLFQAQSVAKKSPGSVTVDMISIGDPPPPAPPEEPY